jgi:hypothetical protein
LWRPSATRKKTHPSVTGFVFPFRTGFDVFPSALLARENAWLRVDWPAGKARRSMRSNENTALRGPVRSGLVAPRQPIRDEDGACLASSGHGRDVITRNSANAPVRRSSSASDPIVIRMESDTLGPEKCRMSTARSRSAADRAWPVWLGWRAKMKLALDGRTSNPSRIRVDARSLSRPSFARLAHPCGKRTSPKPAPMERD